MSDKPSFSSSFYAIEPASRLRRLRRQPVLRAMLSETTMQLEDLVLPLFIRQGKGIVNPIAAMPGHFQYSVDQLDQELAQVSRLGIKAILLFGIPDVKSSHGGGAHLPDAVIPTAIRYIKQQYPDLLVIADLCFCEYTDHGHCGVVSDGPWGKDLDDEATYPLLVQQAIVLAQAGADVIAPSGMVDGMVSVIRAGLDDAQYGHVPILSYAAKYASALYAPFREAALGAPQFGDRCGYQMNPANWREAMREVAEDIKQGADIIMVKPAQWYLDVLITIKQQHPHVPLAAYQVSGQYSMIKAAAAQGYLDETMVMQESLLAIKRAGADMIITYFAKSMAECLQRG